ncbi:MAG: KpsF/GutQ family sugar-phosphate isomerase [Planctomycetota bacterium]|nr:KpsF/GutQ family sugar-phosphate isomerase [Planctomycetota bacterium]
MSMEAPARKSGFSRFEQLRYASEILRTEGQAVVHLADQLSDDFLDATDQISACRGNVILLGMGKAGLIAQKICATLASTGTPSHFLHPAEAVHGDLGKITRSDLVMALSFSGETEEVLRLLPTLRRLDICLIAMTGNPESQLGKAANLVLDLGHLHEACRLGLAPTTSTTAMLSMGDALALVVSRNRNFSAEDFARRHPAGSLGRRLAQVDELMRKLDACRVADERQTVREIIVQTSRPGRRTGAIMLTGPAGTLTGLFTDSDLARLLESGQDQILDQPILQVMTPAPRTVSSNSSVREAVTVLAEHKISELPVVNDNNQPVGMLDITDVVGAMPAPEPPSENPPENSNRDTRPGTLQFPPAVVTPKGNQ